MRHSVALNEMEEAIIEELLTFGVYGRTASEFIRRTLDEKLQSMRKFPLHPL